MNERMNSLIHLLKRKVADTCDKKDDGKYQEQNVTEPFRLSIFSHFGALIKIQPITWRKREIFVCQNLNLEPIVRTIMYDKY